MGTNYLFQANQNLTTVYGLVIRHKLLNSEQDFCDIGKSLSKIGDILKDNKEFWEGVDRRPTSAVNGTAAQYCGFHKMLKMGKALIQDASELNRSYSKISSTQSPVEAQLQSPSCVPKHGRKMLNERVIQPRPRAQTVARRFMEWVSLLFWHAGSSLEEKLGALKVDRCSPLALTNLTFEGLSPYALPFESSFMMIHRQPQGMTKFWRELEEGLGPLSSS
ncbi:hypothetical protein B0H19DRAFT_1242566 [Mycena capillaripes]|nr:hypothetical protein B0H19DRAFT_1242566 [Mycena capillaripes]